MKLSVEAGIIQSYVMTQIETAMLQPTLSVTTPNASVQSASDATKNSASDLSLEVKSVRHIPNVEEQTSLQCSASTPLNKLEFTTQDRAAKTITEAIRRGISEGAYKKMLDKGSLWKNHNFNNQKDLINLSKANMRQLYRSLGTLNQHESDFFARFTESRFFATHTTGAPVENGQGIVSLFSRDKLIERGIIFNENNSPQEDRELLGNDDFVFFSLEVGETPKKPSSRFGGNMFKFDLDKPSFTSVAWLSLTDMRFANTPHLNRHIQGLSCAEYDKLSKRELPRFQTVFHGKDMKAGIALSLIKDFRENLSHTSREKLLCYSTEHDLNRLVNGMYRPEIKVPRHFISDENKKANVVKDNKF